MPVHQRLEAERIREEADQYRALQLFADGVARRAARMAPIYGAIVEAAGADAQAKQLLDELDAQRDRAGQLLVADLTQKGPLRPGLDPARAAQILSVFLEPAADRTLVLHHRWTRTRFSTWLSTTLVDQLLPPLR